MPVTATERYRQFVGTSCRELFCHASCSWHWLTIRAGISTTRQKTVETTYFPYAMLTMALSPAAQALQQL